jgi:hypothetical protein
MLAVGIVHVWSRLLTVGHLGNCLQLVKIVISLIDIPKASLVSAERDTRHWLTARLWQRGQNADLS